VWFTNKYKPLHTIDRDVTTVYTNKLNVKDFVSNTIARTNDRH